MVDKAVAKRRTSPLTRGVTLRLKAANNEVGLHAVDLVRKAIAEALGGDNDMLRFLVGRILPQKSSVSIDDTGRVGKDTRALPSATALLAQFAAEFESDRGIERVSAVGSDGSVFSAEVRDGAGGRRAPVALPKDSGSRGES